MPNFFSFLKASTKKRRRIILLFVLGIVLPSVLLGYLAFRGIQNDRALLEKARLNDHRRIAERIAESLDEKIKNAEEAFSEAVKDFQKQLTGELSSRLENLVNENPLVEQVFLIHDFKSIRFPAAELLYTPDGYRSPSPPQLLAPSAALEIQSARRLEFEERNYAQAMIFYQRLRAQVADRNLEGELLSAVARVQKKSALFKDAISTYRKIADEFSHVVISEGIPLGIAARLELGSLFRTTGDHSSSLTAFMDLYRSLLSREWTLEKAQYDFFAKRVKDSLSEIFSKPPSGLQIQPYIDDFQNFEKEENTKRDSAERVLAFQENAAPFLEAKLTASEAESGDAVLRLTQDIGKYSYLVSIVKPTARTKDKSNTTWGLILDPDGLRENILRPALHQYTSPGETAWAVKGRDGSQVLSSDNPPTGTVTVRTNFNANFPDWSIEFYQPPPRLLNTFLISRRGIYFYMFLLIAGILVFGLILTVRAVSHELELARMKSDFVSTISHEFKSPLTSIRQLAEMLHSGRVPSEERRRQYYDVLLEQSERLSLLTENILNLARIEEGRKEFVFEKTDIHALLKQIISSIQDRVRHEGFSIEVEIKKDLPMIMVDRVGIAQAVTNLIDNAVKYSGESRRIIVGASETDSSVSITVQDFGIGIRKEDLERVFERFFRGGDELTRTIKGSGLGLTLVKEIIEAHNGTVHAESEPGRGSTFFIKLPLPKGEK